MPKSLAFTLIIDLLAFIYLFMDFYKATYTIDKPSGTRKLDDKKIVETKPKSS